METIKNKLVLYGNSVLRTQELFEKFASKKKLDSDCDDMWRLLARFVNESIAIKRV